VDSFLATHDMAPADIPVFLFVHTALSAALVGSTWYLSYVAAGSGIGAVSLDSGEASKSLILNALLSVPIFPEKFRFKANQVIVGLEMSTSSSRLVQFFQRKFPNIDATRLVSSYVEAKVGRLFFKPITVPGRIWISYKASKALRHWSDRGVTKDHLAFYHGRMGPLLAVAPSVSPSRLNWAFCIQSDLSRCSDLPF